MSLRDNRIAFITYYYPPCGGSGVLRIVRFVKHLGAYGWIPYVVTVDRRDIPSLAYGSMATDDSYRGIEGLATTVRVRLRRPSGVLFSCLRWLSSAVRGAKRLLFRRYRASPCGGSTSAGGSAPAGDSAPARDAKDYYSSDAGPLLRFFFEMVLIIDQIFEWAPAAILKGVRFVRDNDITLICSSSPPWSVHLVGLWLKRLCRKRWIMDLRDPIVSIDTGGATPGVPPRVMGGWYRALESSLIRRADVVVCNCEEIRDYYRSRFPGTRFEFVTNGFDPAEFEGGAPAPAPSRARRISHFGELYSTIRTPEPFLRAVAAVFEDRPEARDELSINFYGGGHYLRSNEFRTMLRDLAIEPSVQCFDYVPHREVTDRMRSSDALLLLQPHASTKYQIPAKLYEYIATGRPVLAVAPEDSATSRLIRRYGLGMVHGPDDLSAMKASILSVIAGDAPVPPIDSVAHFSAQETTGRFARIIGDPAPGRDAASREAAVL